MADTLSIYDDMVFLAFLTALYDIVNKLLLIVIIFLRDQRYDSKGRFRYD